MATMIIHDLNDDLVAIFRELANKSGAKTQVSTTVSEPSVAKNHHANDADNLSHVLLTIPQLDGYDDDDIFASDSHPMRDVDWVG